MEIRKEIKRALGPYESHRYPDFDFDGLADQAIVLEVKVHHYNPGTRITWDSTWKRFGWPISEIEDIGIAGKALAIIVPLEEEDGNNA